MSRKSDLKSAWEIKINNWRESGLSGRAWCHQNHIRYHVFLYWRKKLDEVAPSRNQCRALSSVGTFYELLDPPKNGVGIEVECQRTVLRLAKDFDGAIFQRCVQLLRGI